MLLVLLPAYLAKHIFKVDEHAEAVLWQLPSNSVGSIKVSTSLACRCLTWWGTRLAGPTVRDVPHTNRRSVTDMSSCMLRWKAVGSWAPYSTVAGLTCAMPHCVQAIGLDSAGAVGSVNMDN